MTGAPLPAGADAVAMVEHTTRSGDRVKIERALSPGENYNEAASKPAPERLWSRKAPCSAMPRSPWLATVGRGAVSVYRRPACRHSRHR